MSSAITDRFQFLISTDKLEGAIALLQDGNNWIPELAKAEMADISQTWRQLRQQEIRGLISEEKAANQRKEIKKSLEQFLAHHFITPEAKVKKLFRKKLLWYLFIGGIIVILLLLFCLRSSINNLL